MFLEFILIHKAARDSRKKNLCDFADVCCPLSDIRCLMSEDCCLHVCLSVCLSDIYLCDDWYLISAVLSAPLFAVCCLTSWDIFCLMSAVYCLLFTVWYVMSVIRWLLSDASLIWFLDVCTSFDNVMSTICCLLSDVSYLIPDVYFLSLAVWCLLSAVSVSFDIFCLLSAICCLMPLIWYRMSAVWYHLPAVCCLCLLSGVCCLYVSWLWCLLHTCLMSDVKWRGILPVIRPFISHRILLSYKESHLMKTGSIGVSG